MRASSTVETAAAALLLLAAGCYSKVKVEKLLLGTQGESCEAQADCEEGLACVDLVCRPAQAPAPTPDDGGAAPMMTRSLRSGHGESCSRHADCESGLLCVERTCRTDAMPPPMDGPRKGGRGESCVASNDCERGMGCVSDVCRERHRLVSHEVDECHRVECVADDDCCKDFRPEDPALCTELKSSCADGVQSDCNLYASLCNCSRACDDSVCVASVTCKNDLDCGGSGVLRCFAGKCAQCANDGDCSGGAACLGGLCHSGCERNEECALFEVCEAHQCKYVGCQSDRDCFFESGSARSKCVSHTCRTPCEEDIGCPQAFHACVDGYCAFVGCEDDEQCRAVLMLANEPTSDPGRAVCRPPAK